MTLPVEDLYSEHRRFLWGLCYRMLGSAADADDIVQDTFVRAMERPPRRADRPLRPWLVKVALNLSRDALRRRRVRDYVGPWLPSPVDTGDDASPPSHEPAAAPVFEGRYDLLESVSFAFLLALEALTPLQRAVLLLRDVFDYSVKETAEALDVSEANVKTTHHRARQAMAAYDATRRPPTRANQRAAGDALHKFLRCLADHDVDGIESLLAADVQTTTDGGGEFRAALRTIVGRDKVVRFYLATAENARDAGIDVRVLNGFPAVVVELRAFPKDNLAPRFTVSVELNREQKISHIYVVSASRKLTAVRTL